MEADVVSDSEYSQKQRGPDCWLKKAFHSSDSKAEPISTYPAPEERHWTEPELLDCAKRIYQPLPSWQTRIVELHPGTGADELQCTLLVADLIARAGVGLPAISAVKNYVALSYSWGRPALTAPIKCNGFDHGIPGTLHEALWHLRTAEEPQYIWCDAIVN